MMLSKFDRDKKVVKHYAVNACLMPVCAVHGLAVTTVEVKFEEKFFNDFHLNFFHQIQNS